MRHEQAVQVIYDAIDVVNRQLPQSRRLTKSPETIIVGSSGMLDSLGIVNLVLAIEERASEVVGAPVRLLDEGAMLDDSGPFRNVNTLAALLQRVEHSPNPQ
jgi:hypothetical protein